MDERRVPTAGDSPVEYRPDSSYHKPSARPPGTVSWEEHMEAWRGYDREWGCGQTAERLAARGGFYYGELVKYLGREPRTWRER